MFSHFCTVESTINPKLILVLDFFNNRLLLLAVLSDITIGGYQDMLPKKLGR